MGKKPISQWLDFYETPNSRMIVNPFIFGGGTPPLTYLLSEDCEGSGTPSGWVNSGTIDWDYTTSPIYGSESLQTAAGATNVTYSPFATQTEVWAFVRMRKSANGNNANVIAIRGPGGSTQLLRVLNFTGGTYRLDVGTANVTTPAYATGVNLAVWVRYKAGSGADAEGDLWIQDDGTEDLPASPTASITNGTSIASAERLYLSSPNSAFNVFDKIRVAASAIGSNPT